MKKRAKRPATGGSVFPHEQEAVEMASIGMTIRDYFAAQALPLAMNEYRMNINRLNDPLDIEWNSGAGLSCVAGRAYELADAMIDARKPRHD